MPTFKIIDNDIDHLFKLSDDGLSADLYMATYTKSSEEHTQLNLDMLELGELIDNLQHGINKLTELHKQVVKNTFETYLPTKG